MRFRILAIEQQGKEPKYYPQVKKGFFKSWQPITGTDGTVEWSYSQSSAEESIKWYRWYAKCDIFQHPQILKPAKISYINID